MARRFDDAPSDDNQPPRDPRTTVPKTRWREGDPLPDAAAANCRRIGRELRRLSAEFEEVRNDEQVFAETMRNIVVRIFLFFAGKVSVVSFEYI